MKLDDVVLSVLPTLLKHEILIAHNEKRAILFEAVAEDAFIIAKAVLNESVLENKGIVSNASLPKTDCIYPYRRHRGDNGICVRCGKNYRMNEKDKINEKVVNFNS